MNIQKKFNLQVTLLLITLVLLLVPLSLVMAQSATVAPVTGTYAGSVTVDEPATLGALDLVLNMTDSGGALSGQVNASKTQVFLGGPTFTGIITSTQGVTTTFRIDSQVFTGQVSGRMVQRQFTLIGEVSDDADALRGQYTETITGFTPKPLLVKGKFVLVRPTGSEKIVDSITLTPTATATGGPNNPPTPTQTPTATATPPGSGNSWPNSVYLPLVAK